MRFRGFRCPRTREKFSDGLEGEADGGAAVVVGLFGGAGVEVDYLERAAEALLGDVNDVVALAGEGYGQDLRAIAFYQDEFAYVAKRSLGRWRRLCLLGRLRGCGRLNGGRGLLQHDNLRGGLLLRLWSRLADGVRFRGNEIGEAAGGDWIELQQAFCLGDLKLRDGIDGGHHGELAIVVGALIVAEGKTGIRFSKSCKESAPTRPPARVAFEFAAVVSAPLNKAEWECIEVPLPRATGGFACRTVETGTGAA